MAATKGTKNKKVQETEAQTILDSVKDLDLTKTISDIGNLQVSVQATLANLSAALTGKIQQMETVDNAIGLKEQRLEELYNIEKEAISLDELRAQIEETQQDWNRQRNERSRVWSEEEKERLKRWQREAEEHLYATEQAKKRSEDEHAALIERNQRTEQIRQEALTRSWGEREAALKAKEDHVKNLETQVAGFDAKVKADVAKAEAVLTNTLKRHYEHEMALVKKDFDLERKLAESRTASYEQTIVSLNDQIRELQTQLVAARADAKEVTNEALRSASGRQVADALQRVVDNKDGSPAKAK